MTSESETDVDKMNLLILELSQQLPLEAWSLCADQDVFDLPTEEKSRSLPRNACLPKGVSQEAVF